MTAPSLLPLLRAYRESIQHDLASGLATEHTFRPALQRLVESLTAAKATNEPKRSACGAPDFSIWESTASGPNTIGYIEAKDIGVPLDAVESSEQLDRYRSALSNLILTDYVEFRWFVDGEHRRTASLGRKRKDGIDLDLDRDGGGAVGDLLRDFLTHRPAQVSTPQDLAERMARLTRLMREIIVETFDLAAETKFMRDLRAAFEEVLIPRLTSSQFADMFAQTIAYGLFAAAANHDASSPFTRRSAAYEIPRTNPFLRKLFSAITGPDLDEEPFAGIVDDLAFLLAATDMTSVLSAFGSQAKRGDPVVHFYETFLAAYDPGLRERRGVYYTPEPVVSYIVNSSDDVLRAKFALSDGLGEPSPTHAPDATAEGAPRVLILDPACGSGTFLYAVVDRIRDQFRLRGDAGKWSAYVREELIPRLFGFELLVAPYAVAHLKLGMQLAGHDLHADEKRDWSYDLASGERLGIYLTNTLEEALKTSELLLGSYIADEANAAASVKRDLPVLVIMGNPPYSGHSANNGPWIKRLVADYAKTRSTLEKPSQAKWLQDDYIKFIRFGQWRIECTGAGVLAFITNHSYIDSPTFASMRESLLETFSEIYILDLHGSAKKGLRDPDGGIDQNVFDIQQGVCIAIFVKRRDAAGVAVVRHADLYGTREAKYDWLSQHSVNSTPWMEIAPQAPHFLFVPEDAELRSEYDRSWSLANIMDQNGRPAPGIVTTHDQFAISRSAEDARNKVRRFLATTSEGEARSIWRLCSQSQWNYHEAKRHLGASPWESSIRPILYRPFDVRWTVFDPHVAVHRRERVTQHLRAGPNIALVTSRLTKGERFAHVQVTRIVPEAICMSPKTSNNGFVFPLYLYASGGGGKQGRFLLEGEATGRRANLNASFIHELEACTGMGFVADGSGDLEFTFGPDDVLHYFYAVLHAPGYRNRYVELLRHDFPRIPLPPDCAVFTALARLGAELAGLHLFEATPPWVGPNFPVPGTNIVGPGHPRYLGPGSPDPDGDGSINAGRVYISRGSERDESRGQYFQGVDPDTWNFHIGGYRVCEKWLRDRRGLALSLSEIGHYQRVVATVARTMAIMADIDLRTPLWPLDQAHAGAVAETSE